MAFAVHGVEVLFLNNIVNGCILLGGLFFYDIFWVFGTNVMVTVAHSFEAPIKCKFILRFFKDKCDLRFLNVYYDLLQWYSHRIFLKRDCQPAISPCWVSET